MELFKKSIMVGVSVTPGIGLEVAQIDFATQTVLKYGVRPLDFDSVRCEIADLDLFKETLQDLLFELQIPKGAEIILNLPTAVVRVKDYPAALDETQISNAIEEDLAEHHIFRDVEPAISATKMPNSSIQFHKIAYTALSKLMLIEVAMSIKDLGYKPYAIDTSVNSTLNALMYLQRVDTSKDTSWILMTVENTCCRIFTMNGKDYVDAYEERISIGEVLSDAENYATVVSAVSPVLKNLPSKYLCVVSKTNAISAEVLSEKLAYSAPIIHQEANCFSKEAFLQVGPEVDERMASIVSLDVIGAGIYRDFEPYSDAHLNLFNGSLGDIYLADQPPEIVLLGRRYVLSIDFLIKMFILLVIPIVIVMVSLYTFYAKKIAVEQAEIDALETKKTQITQFLKDNENISTDLFDEGDEIRMGLVHNKSVYSYFTIVGTEIPKKLWLTHLKLGEKVVIEGQADNLESVYSFFRSIKDYNPNSEIKLQKLGLATKTSGINTKQQEFDTDSILTSLNADFYEFRISDDINAKDSNNKKASPNGLPNLVPINE